MYINLILFESLNAYALYHYIQDKLHIKITPYPGTTVTEEMMLSAITKIKEH